MSKKRPTEFYRVVREHTFNHPLAKEFSVYGLGIATGSAGIALSLYNIDPSKLPLLKNIPLDRIQWHSLLPWILGVLLVLTGILIIVSFTSWREDVRSAGSDWARRANQDFPDHWPPESFYSENVSIRDCMPHFLWPAAWWGLPMVFLGAGLLCVTRYWV